MEMLAFGFMAGIVFAMIVFLGTLVERMNEHERNHQESLCGHNRDRNVRGLHTVISGDDLLHDTADDEEQEGPSAEEITSVLYVLRMGSSRYERSIIDYLIDKIDERRVNNE